MSGARAPREARAPRAERATLGRILARGWRIFVPVVIGNAAVQSVAVAPGVTPAASPWFVLLAVVSLAAFVCGVALVVAQARAGVEPVSEDPGPLRIPRRQWLAATVALIVIAASAVLLLPSVLVTLTAALVLLPTLAAGPGASGLRALGRVPVRAVALVLVTVVVLVLLGIAALLLGFLVTGALGSALTWLLLGVVAVVLLCGWTALVHRGMARSTGVPRRPAEPARMDARSQLKESTR